MADNGSNHPSPTGNGRDVRGRFGPCNRAGKGNPNQRRVQKLKAMLLRAADPADVLIAARKLMALAKAGDRAAFAEILDRTIGRPLQDWSELQRQIDELRANQAHNGMVN